MLTADLSACPADIRDGFVAIGNFDGVHRGHQSVLRAVLDGAKDTGAPAGVMSFEPHPRTVFRPEEPVFRITPSLERREVLDACGLDFLVEVPFDRAFAALTAEDFVNHALVDRLAVRHVVVGFDFRFGAGRTGTAETLIDMGRRRGFDVTVMPAYAGADDTAVSSSAIRRLLEAGNVTAAADALGYRWFATGKVHHGEKRGRDLGFPTANMRLSPDCRLAHGVYAVRMRADGVVRAGVASYGRRPQFDNGAALLETFVFDFSGDLYGRGVSVEFVESLRPERKFESVQALVGQMNADAETARTITSAIEGQPFGADALRR